MAKNKQAAQSHVGVAKFLLISGFILIAISLILNVLFLRPANFKQRYKALQYDACIKNYSLESCRKKFK